MTTAERKRAERLRQVTGVALDTALAALRQAAARRATAEDRIAALDAQRRTVVQTVEDAAFRAGADLLWQRWADQQRARLNAALARARAEENTARQVASAAFGRDQALGKVIEKRTRRGG